MGKLFLLRFILPLENATVINCHIGMQMKVPEFTLPLPLPVQTDEPLSLSAVISLGLVHKIGRKKTLL